MANSKNINKVLEDHLKEVVKKVYRLDIEEVHVEHPENTEHGDLATNIPLVLASRVKQSPIEVARNLAYEMQENPFEFDFNGKKYHIFKSVEIAEPGFINFVFTPQWLNNVLFEVTLGERNYGASDFWANQKTIVEYTDPNPFKIFHVGHVMTNTVGESLARIFEFLGAEVKRANYQGDVGIHVANSIWGLIKKMGKDNLTLVDLERMELPKRIEYLGQAYSMGAAAYAEGEAAKNEIQLLNNYIYIVAQNILVEEENWSKAVNYQKLVEGQEPPFNLDLIASLYKAGKKWSLDYFETLYERLGTKFDFYYFESKAGEVGLQVVQDHIADGVFKEDQGAVIFEGENYGLHTRVFINSKSLPVYEAKDLGLAISKFGDYDYDKSIIITGNEVNDYFRVVLKAMEMVNTDLAGKTTHIGHGMMVFKHGKMSSRTGDILAGEELLDTVKAKVLEKMSQTENVIVEGEKLDEVSNKVAVASIKYSILKNGIGHDVVYDEEEATNLIGNTGPYLQYTYARTRSVLEKAGMSGEKRHGLLEYIADFDFSEEEMEVLRHIYKFSEQVVLAGERLAPNLVAGFIFDLAHKYNTLYAKIPIIKASSESQKKFRLHLTQAVGQVIHNGLHLLGIPIVDKM